MRLYYHTGEENKEFWDLLEELRTKGESISGKWSGDYFVTRYKMNGTIFEYWENMDLGIPSEIVQIDQYKRSQINEWKQKYADTVNGIILSEYDVKKNDGWFEDCEIEEDVEAI